MPTSTVPDAEVEGSAGLRRDAEIHGAVIPSLISINRSQHLHHLKHRDRESGGEWVRGGSDCVCVCNGRNTHTESAFSYKPLADASRNQNKPNN